MIEVGARENGSGVLVTSEASAHTGSTISAFARDFRDWLGSNVRTLEPFRDRPDTTFDERVEQTLGLQAVLYDTGWARFGWPVRQGGRGGTALLRAAFVEVLADAGYPGRNILEHLEIIAPSLARYGSQEFVERALPETLRGDMRWCQGFSEPAAGSDLAALRTRGEPTRGGFRLNGHKVWTSWAKWATHATVLARTGPREARHKALTMFAVELDRPGVTVNVIRQGNDTDELAEVFLEDVMVEHARVIGEVDGGWTVAMYLLSCERGAFAWQRHVGLYPRLEALLGDRPRPDAHGILGEAASELLAARTRAWSTVQDLSAGGVPGPEAAVNKVLITNAERLALDAARRSRGPSLELGVGPGAARAQEDYLFARATSIYGGTYQIQLNVIAQHLLRRGPKTDPNNDYDVYRDTVQLALNGSPDATTALTELNWWEMAGTESAGDSRLAFGALFEVQGRLLATSPALGAVLAHPVRGLRNRPGLEMGAAAHVEHPNGRLRLWLLPGASSSDEVALRLPDGRTAVAPSSACQLNRPGAIDRTFLACAEVDATHVAIVDVAPEELQKSLAEARLAIAFEILGACEAMLESAILHAAEREQFGRPIAEFQAVQHILAESYVARTALREACQAALHCYRVGPLDHELSALVKILAGRVGALVSQNTLQIFGAIGFTEDHPHNARTRRVLALDCILGSAQELSVEVGRGIAEMRRVPRGLSVDDLPLREGTIRA